MATVNAIGKYKLFICTENRALPSYLYRLHLIWQFVRISVKKYGQLESIRDVYLIRTALCLSVFCSKWCGYKLITKIINLQIRKTVKSMLLWILEYTFVYCFNANSWK